MKKLILLSLLMLLPSLAKAQAIANFANIFVGTTLPSSCRTPSMFISSNSGNVYTCQSSVFVLVGIGGGGVITPAQLPTFNVGTSGIDFNIIKNIADVTFNLPDASCTVRGVVNGNAQIFCGNKTFQGDTVNQGSLYVTDYFSTDYPIEITGETCGTSEANVGLFGFDPVTGQPCYSYDGSTPSSLVPRLDQVLNPTADKTFTMGANRLTFSGFTAPAKQDVILIDDTTGVVNRNLLRSEANVSVGATIFTGTGLDDATFSGTPGNNAQPATNYIVTIDGTGTPDTFTWTINGVTQASNIPITGSAQNLANGVKITFVSTTGHTGVDNWTTTLIGTYGINVGGHNNNATLFADPGQIQAGGPLLVETWYTDEPNPLIYTGAQVKGGEYDGNSTPSNPFITMSIGDCTIDSGTVGCEGLRVLDITGGSTNYAIKTGLGQNSFGDITHGTRFSVQNGTALVSGDFALHANWGASGSIAVNRGTDQSFDVTVTAAGAGQGLNPTVDLTFKDGTWTTVPVFVCNQNGGTGALSFITAAPTATHLIMTYIGTPVVNLTYTISCVGMGI